jgi:hypothetical protein
MLWQNLMWDSWPERLIVIVNAGQFRSEALRAAEGLSSESSVGDNVDELESNQALGELGRCHACSGWTSRPMIRRPTAS